MDYAELLVDLPLKGEWAILKPPGHPKVDLDFPVPKGRKLPYRSATFLRHLLDSILVGATRARGGTVYAPLDGIAVACDDGATHREEHA